MRYTTQFLLSAMAAEQFPSPDVPEIAFLGRSNVGKSSLLNTLTGEKAAKVSSTPGRTRAINFFALLDTSQRRKIVFADLPGYGYARVPREISQTWPQFIEPYLVGRPTLSLCLCLVDANIPPQASDTQLIEFLRHSGRPVLVVATKADRVGTKLQASLNALRKAHGEEHLLAYSAKSGLGQSELWKRLRCACSPESLEGSVG